MRTLATYTILDSTRRLSQAHIGRTHTRTPRKVFHLAHISVGTHMGKMLASWLAVPMVRWPLLLSESVRSCCSPFPCVLLFICVERLTPSSSGFVRFVWRDLSNHHNLNTSTLISAFRAGTANTAGNSLSQPDCHKFSACSEARHKTKHQQEHGYNYCTVFGFLQVQTVSLLLLLWWWCQLKRKHTT